MIDDIVFLGRAVERLSVLIAEQSEAVFDEMGIIIPVRSCSLMAVLAQMKIATASDLARELEQSHQLVLQKIPKLIRLNLVSFEQDKDDARKKLFMLTPEGRGQLEKFDQCRLVLREAYEELFSEIGNVQETIARTTDALHARPLDRRVKTGNQEI